MDFSEPKGPTVTIPGRSAVMVFLETFAPVTASHAELSMSVYSGPIKPDAAVSADSTNGILEPTVPDTAAPTESMAYGLPAWCSCSAGYILLPHDSEIQEGFDSDGAVFLEFGREADIFVA
ncbi:hypothetical protein Nepgr_024665 [Nepenthes gracilis]|uniref:Uncharacterized protein n=1 Tax=Nepenthes gracilis TaxID=150966 RepID=A0AAD3T4Z6_NEPGR|nr:hypothetical protein Nepgr_024665 [Nepenthes gracilis]